jgi:hypothetical protein
MTSSIKGARFKDAEGPKIRIKDNALFESKIVRKFNHTPLHP